MPLAWLQDGVQVCVDGRDEMNVWQSCGKDKTFRIVQSGEVCEDVFVCPWGEPRYVELTNLCINSICPLETVLRYEVCPNQYLERIWTIANNQYLAFFTNPRENNYTNSYFVCKNKFKCIGYSQVCDLVKDFGDGSNEAACTNHFQCISSGDFIPKTQVCNGLFDCMDFRTSVTKDAPQKFYKEFH